ncbi:MAG: bifunctional riboflavin kinase/FAD synthetase [Verrucomicrobiota bacterium]
MKVLNDISEMSSLAGPLHLAIGVFDGLHVGHQAVINRAKESVEKARGTAVVVTFDPHPIDVLSPRNAPRLLTALSHKLSIMHHRLEIPCALVVNFDSDFAAKTGEQFILDLIAGAPEEGIARICVGEDWQFGRQRSGNLGLLKELGARNGFEVSGLPTVEKEGVRVSSTRIREAVAAGDFEVARQLLGRDYTVFGTVIEGRKLGRTIGFPTANFTVHREQLPPTGVYAVRVIGSGDSWDGVANLGYRPTVEGGEVKRLLEVHLFGLNHEIYGEDLEIEFVKFLRPEEKFEGIDALKAQIAEDVESARREFGLHSGVTKKRFSP